jgi:hypothetical protein
MLDQVMEHGATLIHTIIITIDHQMYPISTLPPWKSSMTMPKLSLESVEEADMVMDMATVMDILIIITVTHTLALSTHRLSRKLLKL